MSTNLEVVSRMNGRLAAVRAEALSTPGHVEEALIRAARALTSHLSVESVCAALLDAVEEIFGATSSWVLLHDQATNLLRTVKFRGIGSVAYNDLALPPNVGILGLAFTSRQVVFVPNVSEENRWFDAARVKASGLRSVFMVPLLHKERALGVVGLDSPLFTHDRPPSSANVQRLEAVAAQAAIAIANAQLYDASEQDRRRLRALSQERRRLQGHVSHLREQVKAVGCYGEIVGENPDLYRRSAGSGTRRTSRHHGPASRRHRHRQGVDRQVYSRAEPTGPKPFRGGQLRGAS